MTRCVDEVIWTPTLQYYSRYAESDLLDIIITLAEIRYNIDHTKLKGVVHKYGSEEHGTAAEVSAVRVRNLRFDNDSLHAAVRQRVQRSQYGTSRQGNSGVFSEFLI